MVRLKKRNCKNFKFTVSRLKSQKISWMLKKILISLCHAIQVKILRAGMRHSNQILHTAKQARSLFYKRFNHFEKGTWLRTWVFKHATAQDKFFSTQCWTKDANEASKLNFSKTNKKFVEKQTFLELTSLEYWRWKEKGLQESLSLISMVILFWTPW